MNSQSQILGHDVIVLHGVDTGRFQLISEGGQGLVLIQFGTMGQPTGPGKDTGNRVGRSWITLGRKTIASQVNTLSPFSYLSYLLVFTVMTSDSTMGSFGFQGLSVRCHQNRSHQPKRAIPLSQDVGLHITIVVLTGPYKPAFGLERLSHHVIDQTVFIPQIGTFEFLAVILFIDVLEDILEAAIVFLEDGVFGGHVERHLFGKGHLETAVGKPTDGVVGVVHGKPDTTVGGEVVDLEVLRGTAVSWSEGHFKRPSLVSNEISGAILERERKREDKYISVCVCVQSSALLDHQRHDGQ